MTKFGFLASNIMQDLTKNVLVKEMCKVQTQYKIGVQAKSSRGIEKSPFYWLFALKIFENSNFIAFLR